MILFNVWTVRFIINFLFDRINDRIQRFSWPFNDLFVLYCKKIKQHPNQPIFLAFLVYPIRTIVLNSIHIEYHRGAVNELNVILYVTGISSKFFTAPSFLFLDWHCWRAQLFRNWIAEEIRNRMQAGYFIGWKFFVWMFFFSRYISIYISYCMLCDREQSSYECKLFDRKLI